MKHNAPVDFYFPSLVLYKQFIYMGKAFVVSWGFINNGQVYAYVLMYLFWIAHDYHQIASLTT